MVGKHKFVVERKIGSYLYKQDMNASDSWEGDQNLAHNMQDRITLFDGDTKIKSWEHFQTVANCPGGRVGDSVAPGHYALVWDQDPRQHRGKVHVITLALDMEGQFIDSEGTERIPGKNGEPIDLNRTLWHDDQKLTTSPPGRCRGAWSLGCHITTQDEFADLCASGEARGFVPGDEIPVDLIEVNE